MAVFPLDRRGRYHDPNLGMRPTTQARPFSGFRGDVASKVPLQPIFYWTPSRLKATTNLGYVINHMTFNCYKCGRSLAIELMASMKGWCKPCQAEKMRIWRHKHPQKVSESNHRNWMKRRLRPEVSQQRRAYYLAHGEKRRPDYGAKDKLWKHNNREKRNAAARVVTAVNAGKLKRPNSCDFCNRRCKPGGHHMDYSRVFDVIWLCASCHRFSHSRLPHPIKEWLEAKKSRRAAMA